METIFSLSILLMLPLDFKLSCQFFVLMPIACSKASKMRGAYGQVRADNLSLTMHHLSAVISSLSAAKKRTSTSVLWQPMHTGS